MYYNILNQASQLMTDFTRHDLWYRNPHPIKWPTIQKEYNTLHPYVAW